MSYTEESLAYALHRALIISSSKPFLGISTSNNIALSDNDDDDEVTYKWLTYNDIFLKVLKLSDSLRQLPLLSERRSVIGICADNTIEWLITDFSCCFNDYITVGIHQSWNDDILIAVLKNANVSCIVCKETELIKFIRVSSLCFYLKTIIVIENNKTNDDTNGHGQTYRDSIASHSTTKIVIPMIYSFNELIILSDNDINYFSTYSNISGGSSISNGNINDNSIDNKIASSNSSSSSSSSRSNVKNSDYISSNNDSNSNTSISTNHLKTITGAGGPIPSWFGLHPSIPPTESDEIYTLLYTSGTTGSPKGVAVTKKRWLVDASSNTFPGQSDATVVSYMSLAHGADRGICWQGCFAGAKIGLVNLSDHSVATLLCNIKQVKPTFFLGMSYLWTECYAMYKKQLEV